MPRRDAEISMWFSTMKTADPFPLLAKPQRWGQYHQLPHHSSGQQDCAPSEQRSVYSLPLQSRGQSTHCPFRAEVSLLTAPSELRSVYSLPLQSWGQSTHRDVGDLGDGLHLLWHTDADLRDPQSTADMGPLCATPENNKDETALDRCHSHT